MNQLPPELPSNEDLHKALERLTALEQYVETNVPKNSKRIRDTRAVTALIAFFAPVILFSGEFHIGDKVTANIKSRDIDAGDLISLVGFGLATIGVVSYEDVLSWIKKSKG